MLFRTNSTYTCYSRTSTRPAILAISGTRNWRDVLDDVNVRGNGCDPRGAVHSGFFERSERIWNDLEGGALLRAPLVITGHSLGGGVAVCLACRLEMNGGDVHSVHTFGAPRVGDDAFVRWYDASGLAQKTFRFTTPRDPVPNLPRGWHRHAGEEIRLSCEERRWWQHHDMKAYRGGLKKLTGLSS